MRISLFLLSLSAAWAQSADFSARPAYDRTLASFTSERLPNWLKLSGEFRARVEGRTGFNYQPGNNDAYALVRNRLNVELLPTGWLDFYAQGQDSRVPGLDSGRPLTTFKDPLDLRQAYVRLGKADGLVKVTVGRQLLSYGAQRLIGPLDWTNTSRSWDTVKVELGTPGAKLELFASSVVVIDPANPDHHRDGFNIHGAYGSFKKILPRATVEPYLLWKTGRVSIWTGGLRLAAMPGTPGLRGFDYQAEFARQWGTLGSVSHSAEAGYAILGYSIGRHSWKPHLSAELSRASGDPHPGTGTHRTFDQLLPTNHLFYGITDPAGWQNMDMARVGFDARPHKRLQLAADYRELYLDSAHDSLYTVAGTVAVKPGAGNIARHIGGETDLSAAWAVFSQWKIGGGIGHLKAGDFLKQNSKGSGQTFPYLFAQYSY
uniref:Alginate export domain-containing protein n=1 Tax=Solibacter usitatus (strain Ellin6076) TaxID=234267 RepID=Q02CL5_SOLUE